MIVRMSPLLPAIFSLGLWITGCSYAAGAELRLEIYQYPGARAAGPRVQYVRGEHIPLRISADSGVQGGQIRLAAVTGGQATVVWESAYDRREHAVLLPTADLRSAQYELIATVSGDDETTTSEPLSIGVNPPIRDDFPVFTFSTGKHNAEKSLEGVKELMDRYRIGGYNRFYYFQGHDALLAGGGENTNLIELMNHCISSGMGLVPMMNSFLYGLMDDDTCSVTASGNFPTTYVYEGSLKRMASVTHPRQVDAVKDRLRDFLMFAKRWPCIRGLNLDDEPSVSFYNYFGAGRPDTAPEGEKWWGNGDYNDWNVYRFEQLYGSVPPRYASAREVLKKYPPGTIVDMTDPWFSWMIFTGSLMGRYYEELVPTCKVVAPDLPVFSQPYIGLAGAWAGCEWRQFHAALDSANFHYIAGGHPTEGAASSAILAQSAAPEKPVLAMVHTAHFSALSTPEENIYDPPYVMQQFWSCIGAGVKGIGDQGEFDISQRKDTWEHWQEAAGDVNRVSPLLLKATRPKSPVALLYSVESEWMQAAYLDHPLEIWRQHHTFELIQAALQRANIPFDIVTTLELVEDPRALDSYQAVICAAMDYALRQVYDVILGMGNRLYTTPESALKPPEAQVLKHDFNEVYRLFLEAGIRDPRTFHHVIDERAAYLRGVLDSVPRYSDAEDKDVIVFTLDVPGGKLLTPVNCALNWMFSTDPSREITEKILGVLGSGFSMPKGSVRAGRVDARVSIPTGHHAYDLRVNRQLELKERAGRSWLSCSLDGGEGTLVLVTQTEIARLEMESSEGAAGFRIAALDEGGAPLAWALPVDVKVVQPDRSMSAEYSSRVLVENGSYEGRIDWARNDLEGEWTIKVTELASGRTSEIRILR